MTLDTEAMATLQITKMPNGGFTVGDAFRPDRFSHGPLFACSDIGEALAFIKKTLTPPPVPVSKIDAAMESVIKTATENAVKIASKGNVSGIR